MKPYGGALAVMAARMRWMSSAEAGQTLIEYGLVLALIAMAIVATVAAIGGDVTSLYTSIENRFRDASTP
jgi:Flp pilus assembly pilin Flp